MEAVLVAVVVVVVFKCRHTRPGDAEADQRKAADCRDDAHYHEQNDLQWVEQIILSQCTDK